MQIQRAVSLRPYNTFGLSAEAQFFVEVTSVEELQEALAYGRSRKLPILLLGGGSNILLTKDIPGITVHISIPGIQLIDEDDKHVWLEIGAGEVWHDLVLHTIGNNYGGIENLSLIPGKTGAAPIQNIGAYGVELKDTFYSLRAVHLTTGEIHTFHSEDCDFAYRYSIFKGEYKGEYAITQVCLKLDKSPKLNLEYGTIQETLNDMGISSPTIKDVSEAVTRIRKSKLPDPKEIGNAGSFFKNPELSIDKFNLLKVAFPDMPHYLQPKSMVKVPAAWLIQQCGWKGKKVGETGAHSRQPLVLVNYGKATGNEIKGLAIDIQTSVAQKFGIHLQPEVNII